MMIFDNNIEVSTMQINSYGNIIIDLTGRNEYYISVGGSKLFDELNNLIETLDCFNAENISLTNQIVDATPISTPQNCSPSPAPSVNNERSEQIKLPLPLPSSKMFHLDGLDAVLYDAAVEYLQYKGTGTKK